MTKIKRKLKLETNNKLLVTKYRDRKEIVHRVCIYIYIYIYIINRVLELKFFIVILDFTV